MATLGSGVDGSVCRISRIYEVRGTLQNITSYDNATVGSGSVVNDVQYTGLDRFGRVVDQRWLKSSDGSSLERVKYGFDRASNRLWRENSGASSQDFIHAYDGLNRLTRFRRGNLNATYDDLSSLLFEQQWSLDPTDNWSNLKQDDDGNGTWDLDQNRTHNTANEITQVAGASTYITENLVGNIIKAPKTNNWSAAWDFTYDAWNRRWSE